MCGLTFLYDSSSPGDVLRARTERALAAIKHRGPDDQGLWQHKAASVGHRRLAIIDLSASLQPMLDPTERYVLAYNGEIYNFRELRSALEPHWQFRTQGDTEVVLAGLSVQGSAFVKKMEGMWAFALWDAKEQKLLLSRDRMGKKPLYVRAGPNFLAAASELSALECLSNDAWREDLDSTADYIRYGYYLPGCTAYQGVQEVLPGHNLHWAPRRKSINERYWSLTIGEHGGGKDSAREQLRHTLVNAVRKRMIADVEVGAFLSGGIDSSLVVGIMAKELSIRPQTFTTGFGDRTFDESPYAQEVARRWSTQHRVEHLDSWDRELLQNLLKNHVGQPFADSSLLPTALVSRQASRYVKVCLSGDGGDELFSGYQRYQARALLRWYTRLPRMVRRTTEALARRLPEPMAHHSRSILKKLHLFVDICQRQESERPYVAPVLYSASDLRALVPDLANRGHAPPSLPDRTGLDDIMEMMSSDALVYLPQDILQKVDRASMAFSLEARAPFLDREVVELAFSLPRRWHRRGWYGKRMLRETFADLVSPNVWARRKQGFAVPVHAWFRGELGHELAGLVARHRDAPFDPSTVARLLREHTGGQRDHGYRLWGIYAYLFWRETTSWQRS